MPSYAISNARKFLFDVNSFEEEEKIEPVIVEEYIPPPAPTFSEEELEAAQKDAHERGRQQALKEMKEAEELSAKRSIEALRKSIAELSQSEAARAARYEVEAVRLSLCVMEKIFPAYTATHGLQEVKQTIAGILNTHHPDGQPSIVAKVHQDHVSALAELAEDGVTIEGDPSLGHGDCQIFWSDGGAVRDAKALANAISDALSSSLQGETDKAEQIPD